MGKEPANVPALPQTGLEVLPTRTIYTFEGEGVRLTLTFMTAALPDDLMIYSRPVTYVTWDVAGHGWQGTRSGSAISMPPPKSRSTTAQSAGQLVPIGISAAWLWLKMGSAEQPVLAKKGDDLRIDWGYLYVAAPKSKTA